MALTTTNLNNLSPEELVNILVGTGVTVSNIQITPTEGNGALAIGSFSGGLSDDIGIESGVILSSGNISDAAGPNNTDSTGQGLGTPGDADLDLILNPDLANEPEDGEDPAQVL